MNKLPKFIMLCGLPGTGKSTYCNQFKNKKDYIIVSSDSIREELGDINDQSKNNEVFKILHKRIKEALKNGYNVIQDSTNLSRKHRRHTLEQLKNIPCEKICVLFATPYEICLANNFARDRQVPEAVLERMYKNFEVPCYAEQWDDIQIVWYDYKGMPGFEYDIDVDINKWCEISHNNPHHTLSIGEHLLVAYDYMKYKTDDERLIVSALLHDCGKPDVKAFVNSKGEECDIAHYYNHESVSAYKSLFYLRNIMNPEWSDKDILHVSLLINLHMRPFLAYKHSDKAEAKDRRLFGDKIVDEVLILNECDKAAH